ncbi:MAG TPA: signal peptidase I [Gemmatimonadales bacterium]|nr:signal peptidase I [Gemmatimonadales bacterium]
MTTPPSSPEQPGAPPAAAPAPAPGAAAWALEWIKSIAFAVVVWLLLRTFLVEPFRIPSGSMENTILVGDWLFVNKAIYGAEIPFTPWHFPIFREPKHGDIVIFDSVEEEGLKVVKRLIGLPGDTLEMRAGVVYRNGQRLDEPYVLNSTPGPHTESPDRRFQMRSWQVRHLVGDTTRYFPDLEEWGPIVVPSESLFVMGDHRDSSYDGRYWGFLPRRNIRGTPMFIYYSFDKDTYKPLPFLTNIRWGRFFHVPR